MNCGRVKALLSPWLDGEIEPAVEAALFNHLERCAGCAKAAYAMRSIQSSLRGLATIEPSQDFDFRVWSRIERRTANPLLCWLADLAGGAAEIAPRWATAVFVTAALVASLYWAAQAPARASGEPRTPYDEVQRMLESPTFTAPVALDELSDMPQPFARPWRA